MTSAASDMQIAIVVSPRDWAEQLHRFVADHGGARVTARVLDARSALDEDYRVLLVDDLTSFLTVRLVDEVTSRGRLVVGVYDPNEPWGRERLLEAGVRETIPLTLDPETIVRRLRDRTAGSPAPVTTSSEADAPTEPGGGTSPVGQVIAVTGRSGTGATEVSCALAVALGRQSGPCVLVDADMRSPSIAQRLNLPIHPNIRTAIDAAEHRAGRLDDAIMTTVDRRVGVINGLADGGAWADVRAEEVATVVSDLRHRADHIVVDLGSEIDDLPTALGIGRFDVARRLAEVADLIVAVGVPSPVGVTRLLGTLAELRTLTQRPIFVAVNRAPNSRFKRTEIEEETARTADLSGIGFIPEDRRVGEAAWEGTSVPRSGFTKAVGSLASAIAAAPAPASPVVGVRA